MLRAIGRQARYVVRRLVLQEALRVRARAADQRQMGERDEYGGAMRGFQFRRRMAEIENLRVLFMRAARFQEGEPCGGEGNCGVRGILGIYWRAGRLSD